MNDSTSQPTVRGRKKPFDTIGSVKIRPDDPHVYAGCLGVKAAILHQCLTDEDRDVQDGSRKPLWDFSEPTESEGEGSIGPLVERPDTAAYPRRLFKGPLSRGLAGSSERASGP